MEAEPIGVSKNSGKNLQDLMLYYQAIQDRPG